MVRIVVLQNIDLAEITQTVIALLVVVGGGLALFTGNSNAQAIVPIMSLVIGYYFGKRVGTTNQPGGGESV